MIHYQSTCGTVPTGLYQLEAEAEATLSYTTLMIQELCQSTPWHPDAKFGIDVFRREKKKFSTQW